MSKKKFKGTLTEKDIENSIEYCEKNYLPSSEIEKMDITKNDEDYSVFPKKIKGDKK